METKVLPKVFVPRKRSQRNKLVSALTGLSTAALAIEGVAPNLIPPGTGIIVGQLSGLAALLVNLFAKK